MTERRAAPDGTGRTERRKLKDFRETSLAEAQHKDGNEGNDSTGQRFLGKIKKNDG